MAATGRINHIAREYRSELMTSFFLIICATDDYRINNKVTEEAKQQGIFVNVVDAPKLCDFIVPAIIARGDLTIAVSTSGKSPALARMIKQQIADLYGEEYAVYPELLAEFRQKIKKKCDAAREREQLWQKADVEEILALLKSGKLKDAEDMILNEPRVLGLNHKTSPVEVRESFAIPEEQVYSVLRRLVHEGRQNKPGVSSSFYL